MSDDAKEFLEVMESSDSDEAVILHKKVNRFVLALQDHVTDQLMLTFTGEELTAIQETYGEQFKYRMLPDVQYILSGPTESGTIH